MKVGDEVITNKVARPCRVDNDSVDIDKNVNGVIVNIRRDNGELYVAFYKTSNKRRVRYMSWWMNPKDFSPLYLKPNYFKKE